MIKGQYRSLSHIPSNISLSSQDSYSYIFLHCFRILMFLSFLEALFSFSCLPCLFCSVTPTHSLNVEYQRPRNQQAKPGLTSKLGVGEKLSGQRQNHAITREDTIPTDTAICRHLMLFLIPFTHIFSLSRVLDSLLICSGLKILGRRTQLAEIIAYSHVLGAKVERKVYV